MRFQEFITESKRLKIYFAHPRATYGKPEENKSMTMITKEWPNYLIVNPNVDWIQGRVDQMGFEIFFKVIDTVQVLCVLPFKDGKIGGGSYREAEHAFKNGIPIYVVNPWKNTITETPFKKLKGIDAVETFSRIPKEEQHKWKVHE